MNLQNINDRDLHQSLLSLRSKESKIVAAIIAHLEEVFRRRLFSDYKCTSLYDYCIRILGYSNGEAHHKISACKLALKVEGIKESIAKGELSLSNASFAQSFIRKNNLDAEEVVERIKNKTTRECQKELEIIASEKSIELEPKSKSRNYGDKTLVKVYLDRDKLGLLKSKLGFKTDEEVMQFLMEDKLASLEPKTEVKTKKQQATSKARSISLSKKAFITKRAHNQCEKCASKFNLEIDHIVPVSMGGSNSLENLRLVCRPCNQREAIKVYGDKLMSNYLR